MDIEFNDEKKLKQVSFENEAGKVEHLYLFPGDAPIAGKVHVKLKKKKKLEHLGVKIELLGHIGNRNGLRVQSMLNFDPHGRCCLCFRVVV